MSNANANYPTYPSLESLTKPSLTTAEIAHYTNTKPQTWRQHACYETGPIRPIRILGRLNWPTAQCKKLLGVS